MRVVSLVVLFSSALAWSEVPLRVGVSSLQGVNVPAETTSFYAEHLAQNLRAPGLTVVTAREVSTLLGMERQKQMLGCEASSSCIAELASALGVDAVIVGDVARFGDTYQFNVKVLSAGDAKVFASSTARVDGDVGTLDAVARLARELGRGLFMAKGRPVPAELLEKAAPGLSRFKWVTLGVGVAGGAVGGLLFLGAQGDYAALTGPGAALGPAEAVALREGGGTKQLAGVVLLGVGGASLLATAALFLVGEPGAPAVGALVGPGGGLVTVGGRW